MRAYNEGLGAQPPAESSAEPLARALQGQSPSEAESFKAFLHLKEGPKLYCQ